MLYDLKQNESEKEATKITFEKTGLKIGDLPYSTITGCLLPQITGFDFNHSDKNKISVSLFEEDEDIDLDLHSKIKAVDLEILSMFKRNEIVKRLFQLQDIYLKELKEVSFDDINQLKPMFQDAKNIQRIITKDFIEYISVRL